MKLVILGADGQVGERVRAGHIGVSITDHWGMPNATRPKGARFCHELR